MRNVFSSLVGQINFIAYQFWYNHKTDKSITFLMSEYSKSFFSLRSWKQRLVFWLGAIIIGLLISTMTLLSEWASEFYRSVSLTYPWFNFVVAPFGLALTAWITFRFFSWQSRKRHSSG